MNTLEKKRELNARITDRSAGSTVAMSLCMRYSPGGVVSLGSHLSK